MTVCDSLIATLGEDIWRSMMISDASPAECQLDSEPVNVETDIVVLSDRLVLSVVCQKLFLRRSFW